ncbi:hypothetical protein ACXVUM_08950 [Williamsia sp. SKLECPSW1]
MGEQQRDGELTPPRAVAPRRVPGWGRALALVLASVVGALALAVFVGSTPSHADALCDAMRARFGPGYPCISVPTNTFTPTAPAAPTTTGSSGSSGGGPSVGSNIGPGPGEGNGTPIVPVPGQTPATPAVPGGGPSGGAGGGSESGPVAPNPLTPQSTPNTASVPPSTSPPTRSSTTTAPSATQQSGSETSPRNRQATIGPRDSGDQDTAVTGLWLAAGAAALVAGGLSARSGGFGRYTALARANGYPSVGAALRSWLPRGGSERATIGSSQLVLINDETSPRAYVFHENVPPGGRIDVNPDGSATIYDQNGRAVSHIAKPWAYDSLGQPQRTWYTVDDNGNLVQHVGAELNALYPILADPDKNTLKQIKQQQQAANQGTDAHEKGTGTTVDKSPNAASPSPPQTPASNRPDYGGEPHNQADTHSGLPPQKTVSNDDAQSATSAPDGIGSADGQPEPGSEAIPPIAGPSYDQSPEAVEQRIANEQRIRREEILRSIPPDRPLTPRQNKIYQRLRKSSAGRNARRDMLARDGVPLKGDDDPAFSGRTLSRDSEADHLIALRRLVQIPGFDELSDQQQDEIANQTENIVPSSPAENRSRGAKTYPEYPGHSRYGDIPSERRAEREQQTADTWEKIQQQIADAQAENDRSSSGDSAPRQSFGTKISNAWQSLPLQSKAVIAGTAAAVIIAAGVAALVFG